MKIKIIYPDALITSPDSTFLPLIVKTIIAKAEQGKHDSTHSYLVLTGDFGSIEELVATMKVATSQTDDIVAMQAFQQALGVTLQTQNSKDTYADGCNIMLVIDSPTDLVPTGYKGADGSTTWEELLEGSNFTIDRGKNNKYLIAGYAPNSTHATWAEIALLQAANVQVVFNTADRVDPLRPDPELP